MRAWLFDGRTFLRRRKTKAKAVSLRGSTWLGSFVPSSGSDGPVRLVIFEGGRRLVLPKMTRASSVSITSETAWVRLTGAMLLLTVKGPVKKEAYL